MPEFDRVRDEDSFGVFGEDAVTSIVKQGRPQVETVQGTEVPRATYRCLMMDKDLAACGAHWSGIKIVMAK